MATYDYIVTGVEPEAAFRGAACSDADAWREAILFLSEMLREINVQEGGPFSLQVIVQSGGGEVCRVTACSLPGGV